MANKKIFVSRGLSEDSPIRKIGQDHHLTCQSLIQLSPIAFSPPETDWVFFYSRNGVRYFFEQSNYELYPYMWACLSTGTAEELSKYVLDISFIGSGSPEKIAKSFESVKQPNESVCFIRASQSIDSIKTILNIDQSQSIPVYNNVPLDSIPTGSFDILIFTSPMNVNAWFDRRKYNGERIIAIGNTTASAISNLNITDVLISKEASENGIAEVLESICI